MSQNNNGNNNNNSGGGSSPSFASKASYIGTGVLIGLVAYPFVRKALATFQPKLDKIFDDLTGKAENMAEKASDLIAQAKVNLKRADTAGGEHRHSHEKDHKKDSV